MKNELKSLNLDKLKKILIILLFVASLLLIQTPRSYAQNFSTGVNPSVVQIKAKSPASIKSPLILLNSSDQNITYGIFLRPFKANSDLNGEPNFDPKLTSDYETFFKNVRIFDADKQITQITLAPNEKKELTLNIEVNEETEARDYYFTVIFLSKGADQKIKNNAVFSRGGIGTNVLLSIGSESKPAGRIAQFTGPKIIGGSPAEFTLELANESDSFVSSKGNIIIRNIFGQIVGNIEFGPTNILAGSNRIITDGNNSKLNWDQKFMLGIYKADLKVAISDDGPLLTESQTFIAIPYKAIFTIITSVLILLWLLKLVRKKKVS